MAHNGAPVKPDAGPKRRVVIVVVWERCRSWIDRHPRTGWYMTVLIFLNYIIDAIQSGLF